MPKTILDLTEEERTQKLKNIILDQFGSIRKFADVADIPATTLSGMFSRGVGGASVDRIIKICKILNIEPETFEPPKEEKKVVYELKLEETENNLLVTFRSLNPNYKKLLIEVGTAFLKAQNSKED